MSWLALFVLRHVAFSVFLRVIAVISRSCLTSEDKRWACLLSLHHWECRSSPKQGEKELPLRQGGTATVVPENQGPDVSPPWEAKGREFERERSGHLCSLQVGLCPDSPVHRAQKGMREFMMDVALESISCGTEQNPQGR